jgi:TonB family protein
MTDFLLLLGKSNLAMAVAILAVWLLRRPVRSLFGASVGYALWLLVPVAGLASLLPPRIAAGDPMALTIASPQIAMPAAAFDWSVPLFAAWALGVGAVVLCLARLQARFHKAERNGAAGPAVAGFLRPRIVMPNNFQAQFAPTEQAAILTHERVHLARQDARINALAALLRCLCWFNPLVHLGAGWLRADQELACDAAVLGQDISRRNYARALFKSQTIRTALPLGCMWPGSEHPLTERIAFLSRKTPTVPRRLAGVALVILAASVAGLGAWAAQPAVALPPVEIKPIAGTHVLPPYPKISSKLGEHGRVVMDVTIGTGGNVLKATLAKSSGSDRLDQSALETVRAHWLWQPPTRGGKPVVATTRVAALFALKKAPAKPHHS